MSILAVCACLPARLSVYLSICLSICLSAFLAVSLSSTFSHSIFILGSVCLSFLCMAVCCLSVYLSAYITLSLLFALLHWDHCTSSSSLTMDHRTNLRSFQPLAKD